MIDSDFPLTEAQHRQILKGRLVEIDKLLCSCRKRRKDAIMRAGNPVCDHIVGFVDVAYEGGYLVSDSDGGLDGKIWGNNRDVKERTVFSFCPLCGEKL